jgi:hypothetical protein
MSSSGRRRREGDGWFSSLGPRSTARLPFLTGKLFFQRLHQELHYGQTGSYAVQFQRAMEILRHPCGELDRGLLGSSRQPAGRALRGRQR